MMQNSSAGTTALAEAVRKNSANAVVISDPQAIRALAHEARLEALEELFASQASRTATELAGRCRLTPSAMSYHLRALEKYGFVMRAPSEGDGRERRWRAAGDHLVVGSFRESYAAKNAYLSVQLNAFRDRLTNEIQFRESERAENIEPPADRAPVLTTGLMFMNEEKQKEFIRKMYALVEEYEHISGPEERSIGGERLYYMLSLLPERLNRNAGAPVEDEDFKEDDDAEASS
ncbi:ArsR/SmtB family transcription factor [Neomicrococcus lactis]|uniref:DNA-binding transcriptional ArsR family regulator n=1 Tax=Neomicrococcus lactis TaxID=732241 RepID=A0A7W8YD52_9MICC|nr:helix-turn-helix domain-containing protein [Neomicrococcus lactis]MBB5599324.1 DNA-binding transcriptional ArsR family regulator [Neomicrococcus lactis]